MRSKNGGRDDQRKENSRRIGSDDPQDLSKMDGCPKDGVMVTVYGNPWNAMFTFGVAAGPVRNKAELQRFFDVITERLQRLYDVA